MKSLNEALEERRQEVDITVTDAAKYLGMAQSSLTRKLKGDQPWGLEELLQLCYLLGIRMRDGGAIQRDLPRALLMDTILRALPDTDQQEVAQMVQWMLEGRRGRLKPEGEEALRALKALV